MKTLFTILLLLIVSNSYAQAVLKVDGSHYSVPLVKDIDQQKQTCDGIQRSLDYFQAQIALSTNQLKDCQAELKSANDIGVEEKVIQITPVLMNVDVVDQ